MKELKLVVNKDSWAYATQPDAAFFEKRHRIHIIHVIQYNTLSWLLCLYVAQWSVSTL